MSCWSKVPKSPENAEVYHRCRQRAWLNLLRLGLFQHRRGPAAKMRPGRWGGGWWLVLKYGPEIIGKSEGKMENDGNN